MADRSQWTREDWRRHRTDLNARLRAAYIAGAEERSLREHDRGLTDAELRDALMAYPGDLPIDVEPGPYRR